MVGRQRSRKVPAVERSIVAFVYLVLMTLTLKLSPHLQIVVYSRSSLRVFRSFGLANFVAFIQSRRRKHLNLLLLVLCGPGGKRKVHLTRYYSMSVFTCFNHATRSTHAKSRTQTHTHTAVSINLFSAGVCSGCCISPTRNERNGGVKMQQQIESIRCCCTALLAAPQTTLLYVRSILFGLRSGDFGVVEFSSHRGKSRCGSSTNNPLL